MPNPLLEKVAKIQDTERLNQAQTDRAYSQFGQQKFRLKATHVIVTLIVIGLILGVILAV